MFALINLEMKRFIEVASCNFVAIWFTVIYLGCMHATIFLQLHANFSGFFKHVYCRPFPHLRPALRPTQYTSVLFFSESIMSDESDLNCFKGHILNEEIDRAKVIYSRKQEEFSRSVSQQPKPRYGNLP